VKRKRAYKFLHPALYAIEFPCSLEGGVTELLSSTSDIVLVSLINSVIHRKATFPHFYPQFTTSLSLYTTWLPFARNRCKKIQHQKSLHGKRKMRWTTKKPSQKDFFGLLWITISTPIRIFLSHATLKRFFQFKFKNFQSFRLLGL